MTLLPVHGFCHDAHFESTHRALPRGDHRASYDQIRLIAHLASAAGAMLLIHSDRNHIEGEHETSHSRACP